MKMIVGGAYEGKTDYAKWQFELTDSEIVDGLECSKRDLMNCRCVKHAEELVRRSLKRGEDPMQLADGMIRFNPDMIVIANEVGCGIVPVNSEERAFREAAGRFCTKLAAFSDEVHRVVYGEGMIIKKEEKA